MGLSASSHSPEAIMSGKKAVQELCSTYRFVLFTRAGCGFCMDAEASLTKALGKPGKNWIVHQLQRGTPENDAVAQITGKTSVPQGFCNGLPMGGCNDGPFRGMGIKPNLRAIAEAVEAGENGSIFPFAGNFKSEL